MRISDEELKTGRLRPETVALAVQLIQVNGYVLFEEVLPRSQVDELFRQFIPLTEQFMKKSGFDLETGFHDGTNHIGMHLPFERPFIDEAIIAHPFVTDVVDQILGEDCIVNYFASNTSMPGGKSAQEVHADMGPVFGDLCSVNLPITKLVVNFPLVDVNEHNGPMEIWPGGTHLHPDRWYGRRVVDKPKLAEHMHSVKALMPAGSIMIRDDRMWHRGTPNRSDRPRPNIALIYSTANGPHTPSIQIPQETYDQLSDKARKLFRKEKIGYPVEAAH